MKKSEVAPRVGGVCFAADETIRPCHEQCTLSCIRDLSGRRLRWVLGAGKEDHVARKPRRFLNVMCNVYEIVTYGGERGTRMAFGYA